MLMNAIREVVDFTTEDAASPAGFIGPTNGRITVYRDDARPQIVRPGDPVYVGDVLESDTASSVNVTVIGLTTLLAGGNGRLVVTEARDAD